MVFVNIVLVTLLTIGVAGYKIRFPKKKVSYLLLLIAYALLPLVSILRKGTYESGALSEYVNLSYNFYQNLLSGVLIPQWAYLLCSHYGCPDFIYMYPLPYYIASAFHTLGFSLITSIKLLLVTTYLGSGVAMYYFAKQFMKEKYAFVSAILYLFAPYHLINLHFQVDIAEMTSFVFIPLSFLFTYLLQAKNNSRYFYLSTASIACLILSHPVISFSTIPFLILCNFLVWWDMKKKIRQIFLFFLSIICSLLITTYYWGPAITESKFIYWGVNAITTPLPVQSLLYSPWRLGFLFQGPIGQLSYFLGFAHWIIIIASGVYIYITRSRYRINLLLFFCFISFLIIFISIQEIAAPIWKLPFLKSFQMTSRLLVLIAFFTSLMGGLLLSKTKKQYIWIGICVIAIGTTILNWGNRRPIPQIDDGYLRYELQHKAPNSMDLTSPIWTQFKREYYAKIPQSIDILRGEAKYKTILRQPTIHEYVINAKSKTVLKENTFYYPGWTVYVDGKKTTIDYKDKKYPGIIIFEIEKGLHLIEVRFEQTESRNLFRIISLATLVSLLASLSLRYYSRK
jgi:hypothetical protein